MSNDNRPPLVVRFKKGDYITYSQSEEWYNKWYMKVIWRLEEDITNWKDTNIRTILVRDDVTPSQTPKEITIGNTECLQKLTEAEAMAVLLGAL